MICTLITGGNLSKINIMRETIKKLRVLFVGTQTMGKGINQKVP
jgi:hypothetical protein